MPCDEPSVSGYSYDAAGNMLSDGLTNTLEYDANGMVSWDSGTTYSYNPVGERVGKSGGGVAATDTVYFGGRPIARLSNGAWTDLVYGPIGLLAEVPGTQNGAPVYRMTDHLGSTVGLLSASGTVMGTQDTVPFGQLLPGGGAQDASFPFTELEHDQESGFDHAQYRQYASNTGRWMSPDPYDGSMNLANPQTLNRYAYVGNNPLRFTDPSGLDGEGGSGYGACGDAIESNGGNVGADVTCLGEVINLANDIESFFSHPQFHGSTKARPNQPWGDHHIPYNGNLANILGLPDTSCEFGACGGNFAEGQPSGTAKAVSLFNDALFTYVGLLESFSGRYPHRLFGSRWCGPGGGGPYSNHVDSLCHAHDVCLESHGLTFWPNIGVGVYDANQAMAAKQCNQDLYDDVSMYPNERGSQAIQLWLVYGPGARLLAPGTAAVPGGRQ